MAVFRRILWLSLALLGALVVPPPESAKALQVTPGFFDQRLERGETRDFLIHLKNDETEPLDLVLALTDLTFTPDGQFLISEPSMIRAGFSQLATLRVTSLNLPIKEEQSVNLQLAVPTDWQTGPSYGAILVQNRSLTPLSGSLTSQTQVRSQIIIPFYLDTDGHDPALRRAALTLKDLAVHPRLTFGQAVTINYQLANTGTLHVKPHGNLDLTNQFTSQNLARFQTNSEGRYLVPETSWQDQFVWQPPLFGLGFIRLTLNIAASEAPPLAKSLTIWWISWPLLLGLIGLGSLIIVYRTRRKVRRRLKH